MDLLLCFNNYLSAKPSKLIMSGGKNSCSIRKLIKLGGTETSKSGPELRVHNISKTVAYRASQSGLSLASFPQQ